MKKNLVKIFAVVALMVLAAIVCALLGVKDIAMVIALPFTLLGKGLRLLSLTGNIGNIAAIILYILVCLAPLALGIKGKRKAENLLLPLSSAIMFYIMYYMINPGLRPWILLGTTGDFGLSCAVYSVLLSWAIIKLLRNCDSMDSSSVYRALRILMWMCMAGLAVAIVVQLSSYLYPIANIEVTPDYIAYEVPTGFETAMMAAITILSFAVMALENGLIMYVLFLAIGLVRKLEADPYSEDCCNACEKISKWSKRTLAAVILSNMALNLVQIVFVTFLEYVDVSLNLPIVSIAAAFAFFILSRLLNKGRLIKQDNELFI